MRITFRKINFEDVELIRYWIKTNEFLRKWYYHDSIPRKKTLLQRIALMSDEADMNSMIALLDGNPFGYVQVYPVDGQGPWSKKVKVYENTASIDYFIGDIEYIHRGLGQEMIEECIKQIVRPLGYDYAMISPDPENIASIRCCEKCGFKHYKTVNVPYSNSKEKEAVYIRKM